MEKQRSRSLNMLKINLNPRMIRKMKRRKLKISV